MEKRSRNTLIIIIIIIFSAFHSFEMMTLMSRA